MLSGKMVHSFIRRCFTRSRCRLIPALAQCLFAATRFVAPDGNDANTGTFEKPFVSLNRGSESAKAGDTVYIRGGTFLTSKGIKLTKKGSDLLSAWEFPGIHTDFYVRLLKA